MFVERRQGFALPLLVDVKTGAESGGKKTVWQLLNYVKKKQNAMGFKERHRRRRACEMYY